MNDFLPFTAERIAIVSITRHGLKLAARIAAALPGARLFAPEKFAAEVPAGTTCFAGKVGDQVPALFAGFDGIVAVVSLGAMVRLVAPHLKDKESDPGVVVVDEAGKFAIPMLAGHLGGANALAARLAATLGATPVYTTASDSRATLAVDLLGRELGWTFVADKAVLLRASAAVVNDEPVALVQEAGSPDWWATHANGRSGPRPANLRYFASLEAVRAAEGGAAAPFAAVLWIATRPLPVALAAAFAGRLVAYRPPAAAPRFALGIGCDRGTPAATIRALVDAALQELAARPEQIVGVASIDLKADEAGLHEAVAGYGWALRFYPAAELAGIAVPNPSPTVLRHTGTPSVAEAAALLLAAVDQQRLVIEKLRRCGADGRNATLSAARLAEI